MKLEKRYFSQKVRPKDIMEYFEIIYSKAHGAHLDKDEHQYLVDTLLLIFEGKKALDTPMRSLGLWDKETMWESLAFNETMLFSILDYPASVRALSLYALYKRIPLQSYQYEEIYNKIMTPIVKMYEAGNFIDAYKTKNPKVMKSMGEKEYICPNIEETKKIGFELLHAEARNLLYKRFDQYLREEELNILAGGKLSLFTWTNLNNKKGSPDVELATIGNWNESGKEAAIKEIARDITHNADLLY